MKLAYFPRPLATFAPRDLMLMQMLGVWHGESALEVGTGSGSTMFHLAPRLAQLDGVDISPGPLNRLRRALDQQVDPALRQVNLFQLDFCDPNAADRLPRRYDLVFSCDTLEHVPNPSAFFANTFRALEPGGRLFLTFPNESPQKAHGITAFQYRRELEEAVARAGFARDSITIDRVRMNERADWIAAAGWRWPRRAAKKLLHGFRSRPAPQTFEQTDFFAASSKLERFAPLINAYCWCLMRLVGTDRQVYLTDPAPENIWDMQLLIRAARPVNAASYGTNKVA
jgi:2-polyprenyl-3-methyl-5-hydroxy-6-metoxy-1,4-benzoquinol methylase